MKESMPGLAIMIAKKAKSDLGGDESGDSSRIDDAVADVAKAAKSGDTELLSAALAAWHSAAHAEMDAEE